MNNNKMLQHHNGCCPDIVVLTREAGESQFLERVKSFMQIPRPTGQFCVPGFLLCTQSIDLSIYSPVLEGRDNITHLCIHSSHTLLTHSRYFMKCSWHKWMLAYRTQAIINASAHVLEVLHALSALGQCRGRRTYTPLSLLSRPTRQHDVHKWGCTQTGTMTTRYQWIRLQFWWLTVHQTGM